MVPSFIDLLFENYMNGVGLRGEGVIFHSFLLLFFSCFYYFLAFLCFFLFLNWYKCNMMQYGT